MGDIMSEDKKSQTHTNGQVYVHPRGDKYRENFDKIFGKLVKDPEIDIDCTKECEGCQCETTLIGEVS
jgi:hypothetical protein